MINLFAFLNRKRSYFFALAFVAVASVVLAGNPPQDPLDAPMIQFEKTVEDAFHGKKSEGSEKNELLNLLHNPDKAEKDITLPMASAELTALEKQYGTMKGLIETASKSRQDLEQNDERLKSLARYAARYFTAQKRIYFNFMRNVHRVAGEEFKYDPTTYDNLDLNLQGNAGMELIYLADEAKTGESAFKDSQGNVVSLLLNYNVRHVRGFLDRFNLSQLYMTRADKDELELQAIQDIVSQKNYNKIIAFMTTRTRIGNYWALQRMNTATHLPDPDLTSCGKNFLSFHDLPKNGTNYVPGASYFNSLKNEDRYNEFNKKLEKGLTEKSLNAPLLPVDAMSRVIQNYYSKLPDPDGLDVKMKVQADPDSYSSEAYIQNLLTRAEDLWKTQSATGLKLAGYIGDNWDDASEIADRFAWTVFEQRRVLLINQIVSETDGSFEESDNADQKAKKKVKSLIDSLKGTDEEKHRQLREWAKAAVDSELNVQAELAWRANMKKLVVEYYKSPTSVAIDNGFRNDRLDEVLGDTWNGIQNAVYSKFVESKVDGIKDQATSCLKAYGHYFTIDTTSDKCKYVKDIKDTLGLGERDIDSVDFAKTDSFAAFWPATEAVTTLLQPMTPDQLSTYLFKKLEFWGSDQNDEFPLLKERATKIMSNEATMKGLKNFFASLSKAFAEETLGKGINSNNFLMSNVDQRKILTAALEKVTRSALYDFKDLLDTAPEKEETAPVQVTKFDPKEFPKMEIPAANDVTKMNTFVLKATPTATPENYYSVDRERAVAIDLYLDAMSMMGLTRTLLRYTPVRENLKRYDAKFFIELEKSLDGSKNDDQLYAEDLGARLAPSMLDQKILAQVMVSVAKSQHPILAIQTSIPTFHSIGDIALLRKLSTDIENVPTLLDKLYKIYAPAQTLTQEQAKVLMLDTVKSATSYQDGMLEDACKARPLDVGHGIVDISTDDRWKWMFETSEGFRELVQQLNPAYKKYDAALVKQFRPVLQKLKDDVLDPVCKVAFYASLVLMAAMLTAGIGSFLLVGTWSMGVSSLFSALGLNFLAAGATAAAEGGVSLASYAASMAFNSLAGKWAIYLFNVQIIAIGLNGWVVMPPHLKARLRVANTEVGIHTTVASSRQAIKEYANMIYSERVNFATQVAMQAIFIGRPMVRSVKKTLGTYTKEVIERQSTVVTEEAIAAGKEVNSTGEIVEAGSTNKGLVIKEGEAITHVKDIEREVVLADKTVKKVTWVETTTIEVKNGVKTTSVQLLPKGFKVPSLGQLSAEFGPVSGTKRWLNQSWNSFIKYRGLITLDAAVATYEQAHEMMKRQIMSMFENTDEFIGLASEQVKAVQMQRSGIEYQLEVLERDVRSGGEDFRVWANNNFGGFFAKADQFSGVALTNKASQLMGESGEVVQTGVEAGESLGKMWKQAADKGPWYRFMKIYDEVVMTPREEYWQSVIDLHKKLKEIVPGGNVSLQQMFEGMGNFSPRDVNNFNDIFNFAIRNDSKSAIAAFMKKRFSMSNAPINISKFKQMFKDYAGLNAELGAIAKKNPDAAANLFSKAANKLEGKDFYAVIGVSADANIEEINKVYRKKTTELHPDLHPGDKLKEEEFKQLNEAGQVLTDPVKKKEYDLLRKNIIAGMKRPEKEILMIGLPKDGVPGWDGSRWTSKSKLNTYVQNINKQARVRTDINVRDGKMVPITFDGKPIYVDGGKEIQIYRDVLPSANEVEADGLAKFTGRQTKYVTMMMNGKPIMADGRPLAIEISKIPQDQSIETLYDMLNTVVPYDGDVMLVDLNAEGQPVFNFVKSSEIEPNTDVFNIYK